MPLTQGGEALLRGGEIEAVSLGREQEVKYIGERGVTRAGHWGIGDHVAIPIATGARPAPVALARAGPSALDGGAAPAS